MLFENVVGQKKINKSAAERYQVKDDYQRFNQKNNMVCQPLWKTDMDKLDLNAIIQRGLENVQGQKEGFTPLDWAYFCGAEANFKAADFPINVPNRGGNNWNQPIRPRVEKMGQYSGNLSETAKIIKAMGRNFGADLIGLCRLDRRWVFSHYFDPEKKKDFPIAFSNEGYESVTEPTVLEDGTAVIPSSMQYVVVFIHEMEYNGIKTAPALAQMATVMSAYSKIAYTGSSMAAFIRGLGYNAIPSANCTALSVPLAIDAGLGQLGRYGKLISPVYGSRCRISKVITDLPFEVDSPIDFGVDEFCRDCKICAQACPPKAIPFGDKSYKPAGDFSNSGVYQWQVDHNKCRNFQSKYGTNCGLCISSCPYNRERGFKNWALTSLAASLPLFNKLQMKPVESIKTSRFWEEMIKER